MNQTQIETKRLILKQKHKIQLVIWWVMISALFTYLLMAYTAAVQLDQREIVGPLLTLRYVCFLTAGVFLLLGLITPFLNRKVDSPLLVYFLQLTFYELASISGMIFTFITGRMDLTYYATVAALVAMLIALPRKSASDSNSTQNETKTSEPS